MNRSFTWALVAMGSLACACSAEMTEDDATGTSEDEIRKCADGPTLRGIDISKYQATVDWKKVKSSGKTFAFSRTSDGLNHPDAYFVRNWKGMKDAGLIRGAYQYFRPSQDPTAQANALIDKIESAGGFLPGDLPPVLDFETVDGVSAATAVSRAKTWLAKVEAKFKIKPIVYTGNNMNNVTKSHFSSYLLWVPNYGATCPLMPPGWSKWTFWQDSESGRVPGVNGGTDTNYFNGNLEKLKAITLQAPTDSPAGGDPIPAPVEEPDVETPSAEEPVETPDVPEDAFMGSSYRLDFSGR